MGAAGLQAARDAQDPALTAESASSNLQVTQGPDTVDGEHRGGEIAPELSILLEDLRWDGAGWGGMGWDLIG